MIRARLELVGLAAVELVAVSSSEVVGASPASNCDRAADCVPSCDCASTLLAIPPSRDVRIEVRLADGRELPIRFPGSMDGLFDVCAPEAPFELGRVRNGCDGNPGCDRELRSLGECRAATAQSCEDAKKQEMICFERNQLECEPVRKALEECMMRQEPCDELRERVDLACVDCTGFHFQAVDRCLGACEPVEHAMLEICANPPKECPIERQAIGSELAPPPAFGVCGR